MDSLEIEKDLLTFSKQDLNTLYNYYCVDNISSLAFQIYKKESLSPEFHLAQTTFSPKKSNLPSGSVFEAVINDNFNVFMEFLNAPDFNPNIREPEGLTTNDNRTLLMECVSHSKENGEKYIIELLKKKPDLDLQDNDGWTALMYIARHSNTNSTEETLQLLIDAGAKLDLRDNDGWTALIIAARNTKEESTEKTVRILISAGANLNLKENGYTALMAAAKYSKTTSTEETVQMLIAAGADLNLQNNEGDTALMLSIEFSKTTSTEETAQLLILAKTNLELQNDKGDTAIIKAVKTPSENIIQLLVENGANLDLQNNKGVTALIIALEYYSSTILNQFANIVKILIKAGADPNIKNNKNQTSIDLAKDLSLQLLLIKAGATIPPNNPKLIEFKIDELKIEIVKYKRLLDELELNLLKDNKDCLSTEQNLKGIEDLEKCLKNIKIMIELKPGGKKAKKIAKKYITKF